VETVEADAATGVPARPAVPMLARRVTVWQRMLVGLLLAQGMYYGLRMLCAGVLMTSLDAAGQAAWWATLHGSVTTQVIQGLALLVGGAVAGAGSRRAPMAGGLLGVVNALLLIAVPVVQRQAVSEFLVLGLPLAHAAVGAVAGVLGATVWPPSPDLSGVPLAKPKEPGTSFRVKLDEVADPRPADEPLPLVQLVAGAFVTVFGTVAAARVRDVLSQFVGGIDAGQGPLVAWEMSLLAALLGGVMVGARLNRGGRNGLALGVTAGLGVLVVVIQQGGLRGWSMDTFINSLFAVNLLSSATVPFALAVQTLAFCTLGGWTGSQIFPSPEPDRRPLTRIDA
jgi:hypothetical protein